MYCPKCGSVNDEGSKTCTKCGFDFTTVNERDRNMSSVPSYTPAVNSESHTTKRILCIGAGIIVLIMFFYAAYSISQGGNKIGQIQSVGGKTLEEAYYQELGKIYAGYAMISRAMGVFFASVLFWLGFRD